MQLARILIILISGISILYSQSYPMYGQNQHHTCHIDVTGPVTKPNEYWRFEEKEGRYAGNPVTDNNGNIYVGFHYEDNSNDYICSIDSLGKERWNKTIKDGQSCKPALDESRNRVYFIFGWKGLHCYTLNGDLIWICNEVYSHFCPPTIGDNGNIYLGYDGVGIYCVSPDGVKLWTFYDGGSFDHDAEASALDNTGHVYLPMGDYVYCLNADNGQQVWRVPIHGETSMGVTIANNSIYYVDNGNFICLDMDGNEKWRYDGVGLNHRRAISAIQINGDIIVPGSQWLWGFTKEGAVKFRITMANFNTIITDKNSNIFAYLYAHGLYDLACYNSQGDTLWTRILDNYSSGFEMCLNVNGDIVLGNYSIIYCYSTKTGFSSSTSSSYLPSQSLSASPNPFTTHLSVSLPSSGAIYSLIGQLIMNLPKGKHSLDTSKWREGVYIIKSGKECKRVVKIN